VTKYNSDGTYGDYGEIYLFQGSYQTTVITIGDLQIYKTLDLTTDTPTDTDLTVEVLDATCTTTLIPQTSNTSIDLNGIDTNNTTLCLNFNFQTSDTSKSPKLDKWEQTNEITPDNT
jgi:hypothetical protein